MKAFQKSKSFFVSIVILALSARIEAKSMKSAMIDELKDDESRRTMDFMDRMRTNLAAIANQLAERINHTLEHDWIKSQLSADCRESIIILVSEFVEQKEWAVKGKRKPLESST